MIFATWMSHTQELPVITNSGLKTLSFLFPGWEATSIRTTAFLTREDYPDSPLFQSEAFTALPKTSLRTEGTFHLRSTVFLYYFNLNYHPDFFREKTLSNKNLN